VSPIFAGRAATCWTAYWAGTWGAELSRARSRPDAFRLAVSTDWRWGRGDGRCGRDFRMGPGRVPVGGPGNARPGAPPWEAKRPLFGLERPGGEQRRRTTGDDSRSSRALSGDEWTSWDVGFHPGRGRELAARYTQLVWDMAALFYNPLRLSHVFKKRLRGDTIRVRSLPADAVPGGLTLGGRLELLLGDDGQTTPAVRGLLLRGPGVNFFFFSVSSRN